jgi:hypothetical protein
MIRTATFAAASLIALAGCSNSSDGNDDSNGSPIAVASTTTATAATLKETCPEVEAAIRGVDIISAPAQIAAAEEKVQALSDDGDTETQNGLAPVLEVLEQMRTAKQGQEANAAFGAWTDAVAGLADRCATVGSSAFQ